MLFPEVARSALPIAVAFSALVGAVACGTSSAPETAGDITIEGVVTHARGSDRVFTIEVDNAGRRGRHLIGSRIQIRLSSETVVDWAGSPMIQRGDRLRATVDNPSGDSMRYRARKIERFFSLQD
jgi:hypothetical protein